MPTKAELENTISELKQQIHQLQDFLNESLELNENALEIIERLTESNKLTQKNSNKREATKVKNTKHKHGEMLFHFDESIAKELCKSPQLPHGELMRLRREINKQAVETGLIEAEYDEDYLQKVLTAPNLKKKKKKQLTEFNVGKIFHNPKN